jgi:hypothetical protein
MNQPDERNGWKRALRLRAGGRCFTVARIIVLPPPPGCLAEGVNPDGTVEFSSGPSLDELRDMGQERMLDYLIATRAPDALVFALPAAGPHSDQGLGVWRRYERRAGVRVVRRLPGAPGSRSARAR